MVFKASIGVRLPTSIAFSSSRTSSSFTVSNKENCAISTSSYFLDFVFFFASASLEAISLTREVISSSASSSTISFARLITISGTPASFAT